MSTPTKIYLIISNEKKIEFSAIQPPVLHANERCYKVDENLTLYEIMDWIATGMPEFKDVERIG